jgi:omega-amidase
MSNLRISIIQTSLQWEDKMANMDMLRKKIESIPDKSHLIVLPEMFTTGFSMNNEPLAETMAGPTILWLKEMAASKSAIITGSMIAREETETKAIYYNRLIWMLPTGDFGIYDKRHLFAYGKEDQHYSAGKKRLIASVNTWKVNLQICYDLRFPVWLRQSMSSDIVNKPEYDLLIFVANWPSSRILAWKTLLKARAIENQCYVIGVNRTGMDGRGLDYSGGSMVIGPLGDIIAELGAEEEIFSHELDHEKLLEIRQKFPFWRDADSFFIQS